MTRVKRIYLYLNTTEEVAGDLSQRINGVTISLMSPLKMET